MRPQLGTDAAQPIGRTKSKLAFATVTREVEVQRQDLEEMTMAKKKKGLYANINARRKAGTSRPKSKSTVSPKAFAAMKKGFR